MGPSVFANLQHSDKSKFESGCTEFSPTECMRSHIAIKTVMCKVAKRDLRGLNYNPLIKVFCELFFKKAKIFIFVTPL